MRRYTSNVYYLSTTGNFSKRSSTSMTLNPMRLTLTITERDGNYTIPKVPSNLPSDISIQIVGNTTALEEVQEESIADESFVDLYGRIVDNPRHGTIYFKNGKKILFR